MNRIILDDNGKHLDFAPLTLTRPVGALRVGIMTNKERYQLWWKDVEIGYKTEVYLSGKFGGKEGLLVNACIIPNAELIEALSQLEAGQGLFLGDYWIAGQKNAQDKVNYQGEAPIVLEHRWHLYQKNADILVQDYLLLTAGRTSRQLSSTNTIIGDPGLIFLEEGARVEGSILNTTNGPVYVGKGAEVMEGCLLRGPVAMCDNAVLKMGAKVYGATTLGPFCKVGGEVNNAVFQAYSNKGHDGFLGNSLIGAWCNLGADTNCSNLKNNYGNVRTYSYRTKKQELTDVQFMGVSMGDHSKCSINTMFNTATVIGVAANLFDAGFPPKYVRSFAWGVHGEQYQMDKAIESANRMMERRGTSLSEYDIDILRHIADTE